MAAQLLGVYAEDQDLFARLGCSAENSYPSGAELEAFSEEFEQGFVGGAFFGGSGNGHLQGSPQRADQTLAAGARHHLDSEAAAVGTVRDS